MTDLFKKYDIRAPRYTSYPAMPFWNAQMDECKWLECLGKSLRADSTVDLYIHIPYCERLCWYCGCNRVISKNRNKASEYVDAVLAEFDLYEKRFPELRIRSLHFGGGTPNFLPSRELGRLLSRLRPRFVGEGFEGAAEVDPRTCEEEFLDALAHFGFKRLSFGVQDFDEEVQKAINRVQPFERVQALAAHARKLGFDHLNFDLIWGLPKQSQETVASTISLVKEIAPEQISYYSYAHMPAKFKHQRLIKDSDILKGNEKRALYDLGKELLEAAGYTEIGMDHYALNGSLLEKAAREGRLKRNFMGYTDKKAPNLLGLGASSISDNPYGFAQNLKELPDYLAALSRGELPFAIGHLNGTEDELRSGIIQELMCNLKLDKERIKRLSDYDSLSGKIRSFSRDGLLETTPEGWRVTDTGRKFIRSMAVVFDQYFPAAKEGAFSQTV